jgi:hypothetical protein
VLRQISYDLLEVFLARHDARPELPCVKPPKPGKKPVCSGWQRVPDARRKEAQIALRDVHDLAGGRGLKIFAEEIRRTYPERADEFIALEGRLDKAMWAYLHLPAVFEQAALFARADALANGRYWVKRNSLPRRPVTVDQPMIDHLQDALHGYYWSAEMRGRHCKVEHYDRQNGAQYFYAYLDDWPDKQLVFADDGEIVPRSERFAFSNVFVFNPSEGSLELVAKGGAPVHFPLQRAFCRSVLGIDVRRADPLRPAYLLDHLLEPGFSFVTDPADRVARVILRRMQVVPIVACPDCEDLKLTFRRGSDPVAVLRNVLLGVHLDLSQVSVQEASFEVTLLPDLSGQGKQMTFKVTAPSSCNLKSKPDELREVGERCLRLWGITDA